MTPTPKTLVFILARRGCIAYANEMVNQLPTDKIKIYASRYSEEILPKESLLIPTFRNFTEFIYRTFVTLPNFLWKIRADFRQDYQLFYFPVFHHWNPAILLLAKWLGGKTMLTVHDAIPHAGERQLAQHWFQKITMPLADRLIVLSDFVKQQLPPHLKAKTWVIPHPILLSGQRVPTRTPSKPAKLLFLGRIAHYKGVDLLLEAVQHFPSGKIQLLTIAGLPMQEIVLPNTDFPIQKIARWLSETEVLELLQAHDILILPYREASQSGVVTLGVSSAIPMIVTKVGGLVEQLAADEAIWVEPTAASIQKGLVELIENPNLYEKIHQKLLQKRADQSQIAKQLQALFQDLVNS